MTLSRIDRNSGTAYKQSSLKKVKQFELEILNIYSDYNRVSGELIGASDISNISFEILRIKMKLIFILINLQFITQNQRNSTLKIIRPSLIEILLLLR